MGGLAYALQDDVSPGEGNRGVDLEGAGAGAAHDSHAMQVFFRDMNTASHHAMLDFDVNVEIQGKVLLGVELNDAWV